MTVSNVQYHIADLQTNEVYLNHTLAVLLTPMLVTPSTCTQNAGPENAIRCMFEQSLQMEDL